MENVKHFGYHTLIRIKSTHTHAAHNHFICNGALIEEDFVLTAASCLYTKENKPVTPDYLLITVGEFNRTAQSFESQNRSVSEVMIHPNFNHNRHSNDIALLKLSEPVDIYQDGVRIIPISNGPVKGQTKNCVVTGWGAEDSNAGEEPDTLQALNLTIYGNKSCEKALGHKLDSGMLCAGLAGKGVCHVRIKLQILLIFDF